LKIVQKYKKTIYLLDLKTGRLSQSLAGFNKPQGIAYAPSLKKVFVASAYDGTCRIFGGEPLTLEATVPLSLGADKLGYDPRAEIIFAGHGGQEAHEDYGELAVIDAKTGILKLNVRMEARAGSSMVEGSGERVFTLIPDVSKVAVLNRKTHAVQEIWPIAGVQKTVEMDFDERNHRLFVGSRTPARVSVIDTNSGKVVARLPTVETLDGVFFDASLGRIYVPGGEGFLDVFQQVDADHYAKLARIPTAPGARTGLFVPALKRFYLAVPNTPTRAAEIRVFEVEP
jgi:DNA-binding beta-propeller fold protein YncE